MEHSLAGRFCLFSTFRRLTHNLISCLQKEIGLSWRGINVIPSFADSFPLLQLLSIILVLLKYAIIYKITIFPKKIINFPNVFIRYFFDLEH